MAGHTFHETDKTQNVQTRKKKKQGCSRCHNCWLCSPLKNEALIMTSLACLGIARIIWTGATVVSNNEPSSGIRLILICWSTRWGRSQVAALRARRRGPDQPNEGKTPEAP